MQSASEPGPASGSASGKHISREKVEPPEGAGRGFLRPPGPAEGLQALGRLKGKGSPCFPLSPPALPDLTTQPGGEQRGPGQGKALHSHFY